MMGNKKRSVGVTVFGVLIIAGALFQLPGSVGNARMLLGGAPAGFIAAYFYFTKAFLALGLVSGVGILCLKDIFRKITVALAGLNILDYFILVPLFMVKNLPLYIDREAAQIIAQTPDVSIQGVYFVLWSLAAATAIIDVGVSLAIFWFFTRPAVKAQFS